MPESSDEISQTQGYINVIRSQGAAQRKGREMLDLWARVHDRHTAIQDFLMWMEDEYGIQLDYDYCSKDKPAPLSRVKLADEFLGIDRDQLEAERRQLLKAMRSQHKTETA